MLCPKSLLDKASSKSAVRTAVVNAGSALAMQSVRTAFEKGILDPVFVGDESSIKESAKLLEWDISVFSIVDANDEASAARTAVSLARGGEVDSLMKGDIHTDQLLTAVINKENGLRTDKRLSHAFYMTKPKCEQSICITDAVVNVLPNVEIKLDIARNVTSLMHALGNHNPKIAMLSATEVATPAMPSSVEAAEVVREAQSGAVCGATIEGPYAFDNAVSPVAAKLKNLDGAVAGNADVLLVPNIETGNALFKQMVYFESAAAAGLVLGASVPIILTSRADAIASRLASAALASIYANA